MYIPVIPCPPQRARKKINLVIHYKLKLPIPNLARYELVPGTPVPSSQLARYGIILDLLDKRSK